MAHRARRVGRASLRATVAAALTCLALTAPAQATQVGAVTDITWGTSRTEIDRTVALLRESGVSTVRANVSWSALEPNRKGELDATALANYDYAVDRARQAGLHVLMPISDGVPFWASADPNRSDAGGTRQWNRYWRPVSFADYADFARRVVLRYKDRGVHAYEVWNEPNHPRFWPSGVDAGEYAAMLKAAAPAIRAADPAATVVLGGLTKSDYPYLEKLYAAGARGSFDVVAIHPYTGSVDPALCWKQAGTTRNAWDAFCGIEEVRASMVAAGDSAKPIWLTEFGWSTNTTAYGVSESEQAAFLTRAFAQLETYPYVAKAYWYAFRNLSWSRDDPLDWEANLGVLRTDFSPKPAHAALKTVASRAATQTQTLTPTPTPPPVDAPPTVRLTAPLSGATFSSRLAFAATARDDQRVSKVEFLVDGRVVATDWTAPYTATWYATRTTSLGWHTATARAVDSTGQATRSSVRVKRTSTATAAATRGSRGRPGSAKRAGRGRAAT